MKIVKSSLKIALGVSIGTTIGGAIIPRLWLYPNLYNDTYPPLGVYFVFYFVASVIICFPVSLLINWIIVKIKK